MLTVAPDNERALGLYQSAGFVDEAFIPDFYGERRRTGTSCAGASARGGLHGSV